MSNSITSYTGEPLDGRHRSVTSPHPNGSHLTATLSGRIADWRRRRLAIDELPRFSDHHLADIGVSRTEVAWVVHGKSA